ncbi:hypothetical protein REPUB_Repub13aG0021000 [Reevesia pubescens]
MSDFQEVIYDCGLQSLPFTGPMMTWSKGSGENRIFERLDMSFANNAWWNLFTFASEDHLISSTFDHLPLLIQLRSHPPQARARRQSLKHWNRNVIGSLEQ